MTFVSVTRLRLRSPRHLPAFLPDVLGSVRQLRRAPGFLDGRLVLEPTLGFWTVTAWKDEASMRAYRNAGAHRRAMPKLLDWCDEASLAHWSQAEATAPAADQLVDRMLAHGRVSKLRQPSREHAAGQVAPVGRHLLAGPRVRPSRR